VILIGSAFRLHDVMKIGFVSTMNYNSWGGCEELWSQAALRLHEQADNVYSYCGNRVFEHNRLKMLRDANVVRSYSTDSSSFFYRCIHRLAPRWIRMNWVEKVGVELLKLEVGGVVVSQGSAWDGLEMAEHLRSLGMRYIVVIHQVWEDAWPDDEMARRMQSAYYGAECTCLVSEGNRNLLEDQIGELPNAVIVRNPFSVAYDNPIAWPSPVLPAKFAAVGALAPAQKAQDLLLHAFAQPIWREREWHLEFYGDGPNRKSLEALAKKLNLDNVSFVGYVESISDIWKHNHLLLHCTRREGMPIVIVEAMLCGRPAVVTNIAGNGELVQDGVEGFVADAPALKCVLEALERAWNRRADWQQMGLLAHERAQALISEDPVADFCALVKGRFDCEWKP
jgi:glycosyltransferase involved in cell wall biosynthesis